LRFLRGYQKQAIAALQSAVQAGKDLFLFQMTTGTGKTSGMWDERLLVALYLPDSPPIEPYFFGRQKGK
jgi:hypothetical protein